MSLRRSPKGFGTAREKRKDTPMSEATPTLPQLSSERVMIGRLQLHYLDWGNVAAPALLCVHGYTSIADAFNGFARKFRDRFSCRHKGE